jgi:selenocysteine lyase/cysteine desulfurase
MLECQRDKFALPKGVAYLDAAYMSPIPLAAVEAGVAGTAVKAAPWKMTIASYYDEVEELRGLAAALIGAKPDDVAIGAATSYGIAVAAANVPVAPGSAILLMENEHPSHRYVWYELATRNNARISIVPKPDDADWTTAIVAAIRNSDVPISVVAGTMVHWFEGTSVDLEAVADASRAKGACLVVDGTQWVGALPFDVAKVQPDFLSFAAYKFLLGPYRLSFLYASERWQREGRPLEHHAWNRVGGDKSDFYATQVPEFLPGARRFDMGERSDFAVLPVAVASLKLLNGWGLQNSFVRLKHLNDLIWQEAEGRGLISAAAKFRAPHISILDFEDRLPVDISATLKKANIHVTVRGGKIRISPHVYNDEEDVKRLFDVLSASMSAGRR